MQNDLNYALENGISINPVLASFALAVKRYNIQRSHIDAFMTSMKSDLYKTDYGTHDELKAYIYGSADVVGLMCLKIFCNGNEKLYKSLEYSAQKLGTAFQKVNFLRDMHMDKANLGRTYFPEIINHQLNSERKKLIEQQIEQDFNEAWVGIKQLPGRSKFAVALAFFYYKSLFNKIKKSSPQQILSERVRVNNLCKYFIMFKVAILYKLKFI